MAIASSPILSTRGSIGLCHRNVGATRWYTKAASRVLGGRHELWNVSRYGLRSQQGRRSQGLTGVPRAEFKFRNPFKPGKESDAGLPPLDIPPPPVYEAGQEEASAPPVYDQEDANALEIVALRVRRASIAFGRYGALGFWIQLTCSVVAATILAFSTAITGQHTNRLSLYLTAGGVVSGFFSVFWSWGYSKLSNSLASAVDNPQLAPPRAEVVRNLTNGVIINLVGMGMTILGAQATVGLLVAKSLTSASVPYMANTPTGYSPVLALDVFLVQASFNVVTSHFFGLLFSLLLLRNVTAGQPPPEGIVPKTA